MGKYAGVKTHYTPVYVADQAKQLQYDKHFTLKRTSETFLYSPKLNNNVYV